MNLGFPNIHVYYPVLSLSAAADGEILVFSSLLDTKLDVLHGREQGATLVGDLFTGTGKNVKKICPVKVISPSTMYLST